MPISPITWVDKNMELPWVALRCHENSLLVSENVAVGRLNRFSKMVGASSILSLNFYL